jgi:hypothetical protein
MEVSVLVEAMMRQRVLKHTGWGAWVLDTEALVLVLTGEHGPYEIDLESITDSSRMLDWIFQIRMKTWSTNNIVGDLISAFQDIFRPQATLCGGGVGKELDAGAFLRKKLDQLVDSN